MRKGHFGVVIVILICLIFVKLAYAYEIKKELQDLRAYVQNIMLTSDGKPFSTTNIRVSGVGGNGNKGVMYISGDLWVGKNGGNNIYTNSINGNVGIGTTTPLSRLEVNGNIRNTGGMKIGGNIGIGTTTPNRKQHVYSGVGNVEIDIQSIAGANRHYGIYHDGNDLRIRANGGNRLTIANNGNVGLSTDTPGARLDISGDLKIGTTADACNAGTVGKIRTNFTTKNLEYCNGTSWIKVNLPQCGDGEYLQYKSNAWTCVTANKTVSGCGGAIPTNGVSNATTTTRTQTWNLLSWEPINTRHYSSTPGVCTYKCSSGTRDPITKCQVDADGDGVFNTTDCRDTDPNIINPSSGQCNQDNDAYINKTACKTFVYGTCDSNDTRYGTTHCVNSMPNRTNCSGGQIDYAGTVNGRDPYQCVSLCNQLSQGGCCMAYNHAYGPQTYCYLYSGSPQPGPRDGLWATSCSFY